SKDPAIHFIRLSAITEGIPRLREIVKKERNIFTSEKKFAIFVDEIHHFNKKQQDFFLPYIESGEVTLIAATTENPSFYLINPLLSRLNVFILKPLEKEDIVNILKRAIEKKEEWTQRDFELTEKGFDSIIALSGFDARVSLKILENVIMGLDKKVINGEDIEKFVQMSNLKYDKKGDYHYNLISALHKSLRGSDVSASLYWAERMLLSGEEPRYIIRRLIRFASEDIGLADPNALNIATNVLKAYEFLGSPEGHIAILEAVTYLALSPKSNAIYMAEQNLKKVIEKTGDLEVPFIIRNAPSDLMKDIGYGKGYEYSHEFPEGINGQKYLPQEIINEEFYFPTDRGFEDKMKKRIEIIKKIKEKYNEKK
ncbi:replication-associated recombination protein A, partial [bacterium]|nr:replication-associated recombination protein A [bacterium]